MDTNLETPAHNALVEGDDTSTTAEHGSPEEEALETEESVISASDRLPNEIKSMIYWMLIPDNSTPESVLQELTDKMKGPVDAAKAILQAANAALTMVSNAFAAARIAAAASSAQSATAPAHLLAAAPAPLLAITPAPPVAPAPTTQATASASTSTTAAPLPSSAFVPIFTPHCLNFRTDPTPGPNFINDPTHTDYSHFMVTCSPSTDPADDNATNLLHMPSISQMYWLISFIQNAVPSPTTSMSIRLAASLMQLPAWSVIQVRNPSPQAPNPNLPNAFPTWFIDSMYLLHQAMFACNQLRPLYPPGPQSVVHGAMNLGSRAGGTWSQTSVLTLTMPSQTVHIVYFPSLGIDFGSTHHMFGYNALETGHVQNHMAHYGMGVYIPMNAGIPAPLGPFGHPHLIALVGTSVHGPITHHLAGTPGNLTTSHVIATILPMLGQANMPTDDDEEAGDSDEEDEDVNMEFYYRSCYRRVDKYRLVSMLTWKPPPLFNAKPQIWNDSALIIRKCRFVFDLVRPRAARDNPDPNYPWLPVLPPGYEDVQAHLPRTTLRPPYSTIAADRWLRLASRPNRRWDAIPMLHLRILVVAAPPFILDLDFHQGTARVTTVVREYPRPKNASQHLLHPRKLHDLQELVQVRVSQSVRSNLRTGFTREDVKTAILAVNTFNQQQNAAREANCECGHHY